MIHVTEAKRGIQLKGVRSPLLNVVAAIGC